MRTGNHCLSEGGGYDDSIRVSTHVYHSAAELDRFAGFLSLMAEGAVA